MAVRDIDRRNLDLALAEIRFRVTGATVAHFTTSDQDRQGFRLSDVTYGDGESASESLDLTVYNELVDSVCEYVQDIDWRGVMGEDKYGNARIAIPAEADDMLTTMTAPDGGIVSGQHRHAATITRGVRVIEAIRAVVGEDAGQRAEDEPATLGEIAATVRRQLAMNLYLSPDDDDHDFRHINDASEPEITTAEATPGNVEGVATLNLYTAAGESFAVTIERTLAAVETPPATASLVRQLRERGLAVVVFEPAEYDTIIDPNKRDRLESELVRLGNEAIADLS